MNEHTTYLSVDKRSKFQKVPNRYRGQGSGRREMEHRFIYISHRTSTNLFPTTFHLQRTSLSLFLRLFLPFSHPLGLVSPSLRTHRRPERTMVN